ncbi:hypothetical protein J31TS3_22300 [Paenibacillus lactis]|nr:hypothetical protein J31TS3_22300 [Paenibacillus lactis]
MVGAVLEALILIIAPRRFFYLIGKPFWGMGYASEAVKALVEYCFNELALAELVAVVKPGNQPSRKVLDKLGFEYVHQVSGLPEEFDF